MGTRSPTKDEAAFIAVKKRKAVRMTVQTSPRSSSLESRTKRRLVSDEDLEEEVVKTSGLEGCIKTLEEEVANLQKWIDKNKKREIKACVVNLRRYMDELLLVKANIMLRSKDIKAKCLAAEVDQATQTIRETGMTKTRKAVIEGVNPEEVPSLINRKWENEWFECIEVGKEEEINSFESKKIVIVDVNLDARTPFEKKVEKMFCL